MEMAQIGSKEPTTIAGGTTGVYQTVVLSDGGWVTTWTSDEQTTWGYGVFQQVYNADGTARTETTRITPDTRDGSGDQPSVTALANGGWVVSYYTGFNNRSTIIQQVFDATGEPQGEPAQVVVDASGGVSYLGTRNILLSDGGWVITWSTWDNATFQRSYNADGSPRSNTTKIYDSYAEPKMVALPDGGWVHTWSENAYIWSDLHGREISGHHIFQQAYNADGTLRGEKVRVDTPVENYVQGHRIAVLADGGWVVTWVAPDSYDYGIFQQKYKVNGTPAGGEVRVNSFTDSAQMYPEITVLADGGWVVVWQSRDQDYPGHDIYQQVYNANGTTRGGETRVNEKMEGEQGGQIVTALAGGGWVITWATSTSDEQGYGVRDYFQQVFNADGSRNGKETKIGRSDISNQQYVSDVVALPDGSWLVTWNTDLWLSKDEYYGWKGTVSQTQHRLNEKPTTQNHDAVTLENGKVAIDVLSSALDVDGDKLKVTEANVISGFGEASVDKDGKIVFDPTKVPNQGLAEGETKTVVIAYTIADPYGGTANAKVTITVSGVNDAPVITSNGGGEAATVTLTENSTAVTTVMAVDPDAGAKISYSIAAGGDGALFTIDSTGVLTFTKAPDFEKPADKDKDNVYDVTVEISDGKLSDTQDLKVTVTNVNEAPVITSNGGKDKAALKVAENKTAVTTVKASDPDAGAKLVYSIAGGADKALFKIGAKTGVLSFREAPDFEKPADKGKDNVYDVTVKVSDGKLSDTQTLKVTVTDVKGKTFTGTSKADSFTGTTEADMLNGAGGNDTLKGGAGNDKLYGGVGKDKLTGGADADTFIFKSVADSTVAASGRDTIYDFSRSQKDKIDLAAIDANTTVKADQAFKFIGTEKFHKKAGELRYEQKSGNIYVYGDVDGDGTADFAIHLSGSLTLAKGDFIL